MLRHYWTIALRNFARFKLATGINILCLAIGLSCFVAAMGAVQYLRSSDRHWVKADRIVVITQRLRSAERGFDTGVLTETSPPVARYLRLDMPELEAVARIEDMNDDVAMVTAEGNKISARVAGAEADILKIFDFPFLEGHHEEALSRPGSIVLSQELAIALFGQKSPLGSTILLDNSTEVTVSGVLGPIPQPSHFGSSPNSLVRFDALISIDVLDDLIRKARGRSRDEEPEANQWGTIPFHTYALMPENSRMTVESLNSILAGLASRYIPTERLASIDYEFAAMPVSSLWASALDAQITRGTGLSLIATLQMLAGIILFMSCLNYANSVTAQTIARIKEAAMRKVLGASNTHVMLQPIVEAAVLALVAMAIAVLVLFASIPLLGAISRVLLENVRRDVFFVVPALVMLVAVVGTAAGLYPGLRLTKTKPAESLRSAKSRLGRSYVPKILVGLQFAVASLLLILVSVVYMQNEVMRRTALSSRNDPVVVIANDLRNVKVDFESLRAELLKAPEIKAVAMLNDLPWSEGLGTFILGRNTGGRYFEIQPLFHIVSHDTLSVLDIPLLAGRAFDRAFGDDLMTAMDLDQMDRSRAYSIVIDRVAAEGLGYETPAAAVGEIIEIPLSRVGRGRDQPVRIIGVAESRPLTVTAPATGVSSVMYILMPPGIGYPLVRIDRNDPARALAAIDAAWNRLAPNFPVNRRFVDELFEQSYAAYLRIGWITTALTIAAFSIAFLGLFGMASFVAARRTHEVGVRKSLGARSAQIITLLLKDFSIPILVTSVAAWPLAYLACQAYLAPFLERVPVTPLPFILSLAVTTLIAWLAVISQTLHAACLNPATVLRYE